ncbi:cytochrome c biogenesis protein ResB [Microbacterium sp. LRZ72]|uniref:cytochrome c biogenesis protein ResB n=1 Tax=Microbacterium sp. LRZ72 TaxID=2942481 RepID=UPI0029B12B52|nr:cytochrome c biogenesis protein ResB [Microbacterium sp. LRZ72]MDX2377586.1 cytochrome c biogenesis protein ResB [Microbacterium sp. LRZ72]
MSRSRSESETTDEAFDPLRPSDHNDSAAEITQPALGAAGWLRWAWRQLTSMRTALLLLLSLAIAAVPGSLFPQRSADPNGVIQWERDNPDLFPLADMVGLFDVYQSPWFAAIYLLLFASLIGCVIPRTRHHYKALRSQPPRTPARLSRLPAHHETTLPAHNAQQDPAKVAVDIAERQLRRIGYRVQRYDGTGWASLSAERGYLRETGNLIFHVALVGVLVSVGFGSAFAYTGQRVVVEGTTFVNALSDYSSFNPGRFVDGAGLAPYSLTLDDFQVSYRLPGTAGAGQAGDFSADVTIRAPGAEDRAESVIVNRPITVAGDRVYLLGNGYAPTLTIRDSEGAVVYSESQPFLPQDSNMTSLGIIKIPDGLPEQLGLVGFFYPTQGVLPSGAFTSIYPDAANPVLTLNVFSGDLGIDDGTPRSVYTLEVEGLTQHTGGDSGADSLELIPGQTAELPNGWGSVTWEDALDVAGEPVKRFASLQIQNDPSGTWVLVFATLATLGLFAGLFVPRRRLWVKAVPAAGGIHIEYAGLARGEDPTLARAVTDLAAKHTTAYTAEAQDR